MNTYIITFILLSIFFYLLNLFLSNSKAEAIKTIRGNNLFSIYFSKNLEELKQRNILRNDKKWITANKVLAISVVLFALAFTCIYILLNVFSTSIILSIPFLISPIVISKILININKRKILNILPMYVVNLKNYITEENDIISAMTKAHVEQPLAYFVSKFKNNVMRGINAIQALDMLESDVGIKEFSDLIAGIKLCYINGGNFTSVLEKYTNIITKEATYREETEEKAFSSMITLLIMTVLNIIVVIFILKNNEYSNIIRTTFIGKTILNINAISYMIIAYLATKIYREE